MKYISCLPKLLILNHHVLEAGDAIGFECLLNPINGFLFKSWKLGVMDNLGDCRIKISVEADVDGGLVVVMNLGLIVIELDALLLLHFHWFSMDQVQKISVDFIDRFGIFMVICVVYKDFLKYSVLLPF